MYAVGLALCTFANIASEEMSRDLCNEVEKLLGSGNTYIRKKVRFCPASMFVTQLSIGCIMRSPNSAESTRSDRPLHV